MKHEIRASLVKQYRGLTELDRYLKTTRKAFYSEVIGKTWIGLKRWNKVGEERPFAIEFRFPSIMNDGSVNVQSREVCFRTKKELLRFGAFLEDLQ